MVFVMSRRSLTQTRIALFIMVFRATASILCLLFSAVTGNEVSREFMPSVETGVSLVVDGLGAGWSQRKGSTQKKLWYLANSHST